MYINQLSVFIENKPGNLADFTEFLAKNGINMRAFQIADTNDYGIIRVIVDDPYETMTLLKDNDWVCKLTPVIGVRMPDEPGSMAKAMSLLAAEGISVDYVYVFLAKSSDDAYMIFKTADNEKVSKLLKKAGFTLVSQDDLTENL